jgi:ABC-2 type transport system permease protein
MRTLTAFNHRGGLALVKSTWASWLQYRSFFFLLAFGWMIPPLIYLFVWSTAAGGGQLGGLTRGGFVGYYLVLILVNQITYSQTNWTVGDVIRQGGLNTWLLRPMPPLYNALSAELAGKVVTMIFAVPVAALLAVLLRPELHPAPGGALLSLVAIGLAWALRFFWGLWIALLAFWTTRADALLAVQDALVFVLAGVVAPVGLLPAALQSAAHLLPFRYMVGFPVEILTGQLSAGEILAGFGIQVAWLTVALTLSARIWTAGLRRYAAIGG